MILSLNIVCYTNNLILLYFRFATIWLQRGNDCRNKVTLVTRNQDQVPLLEPASLMAEVLETEQMLEERRGCT